MNKKKLEISLTERRQATDTFSIEPLQAIIDKRLDSSIDNNIFSVKELKQLGKLADQALKQVHKDDPYAAEVFLFVGDERAPVYDMEVVPPLRVTFDGAPPYGYVSGFVLDTLPDQDRFALSAAFEEYSEDVTELTKSYLVPLAIAGVDYAARLADAPTPVGESGVEVSTQDMLQDMDKQDIEQDKVHSLLDIVEKDLFDGNIRSTRRLAESLVSLKAAGLIGQFDDMATATNYYLQKYLHSSRPWLVKPSGIMERIDNTKDFDQETGERQGIAEWVSETLTVIGIDILEIENKEVDPPEDEDEDEPEAQDKDLNVWCQVYALSDEGALYRRPVNGDQRLILYREQNR